MSRITPRYPETIWKIVTTTSRGEDGEDLSEFLMQGYEPYAAYRLPDGQTKHWLRRRIYNPKYGHG